jgi:hypothetical protein
MCSMFDAILNQTDLDGGFELLPHAESSRAALCGELA